jgi:hypothetical protein
MRNFLKFTVPGVVLAAGILLNVSTTSAKPEYTKKEKKACVYCHVKAGSAELNDAGKYYAAHNHSLEGYQAQK